MAFSRTVIAVALTAAIFSTIAMATDFIVGDEKGWTPGFDYQAWAANKVFRVGDNLLFVYPIGKDSVFRVNGTDFQNCAITAGSPGFASGWDLISLSTTGRRWYTSGVGSHCQLGQKLFITVLPAEAEPPSAASPWRSISPAPSPSAFPNQNVPNFSGWLPRKLFKRYHY